MNKYGIIIILFFSLGAYAQNAITNPSEIINNNTRVIVPGIGAEGVLLGDKEGDVIRKYKDSDISIIRTEKKDFFSDVLRINAPCPVYFNKIIKIANANIACFLYNGSVCAITGSNNDSVVLNNISIINGVDYFIYSFGNRGIIKFQSGKNQLLLYAEKGICIADDDNDNDIDLYAVFKCNATQGVR
ncbi:MAG TPA: hypothetical protein PK926_02370 [Spirochaetota bacterium]|nr:hypothetical protein [Spirochaetota bacterium]HPI88355.1 hypothetical protein [Spirochaetota bacterium]HPR46787.1 hypothetical protein [Spirochaetota bacterium]